ncbi:MAG: CDP-alcohol phosphatidyltransferase family protein [Aquificaceae bacterium]|nr:CDP-alcohol phosphatidyltransferase family protein [Aquificaceae bacterium]
MRSDLYLKTPNLLSLSRLLLSPMLLFLQEELLALFFLTLALSDAFDGFLARKLKAQTELGKVLDPLADKVMLLCGLFLCVYKLRGLPEWLFYLSLLRDLFLLFGATLLTLKGRGVPSARLVGKAHTFFLSLLLFLCMLGLPVEGLSFLALMLLIASWFDYLSVGLKKFRNQTSSLSLS